MTMPNAREPLLNPVPIMELRPTQITVGLREVKAKRKHWREQADAKGAEFLGKHMIPVILGPKQRHYVIDHHHLALALHEEGVKDILVTVVANLSKLEKDAFWVVLDNRSWMHPFDDQGRRRDYADIPKSPTSSTIRSVVWPANSGLPVDTPRIRPPSANFSGRISCVGG
jgi:hypothetical protein